MLIYITILTGSLVALLAIALTYKTICLIFRSVSRSRRSVSSANKTVTSRFSSAAHRKKGRLGKAVHDSLIPLNRRHHETAWDRTKTHPVNPDAHRNENFAWLQRERKSVLVEDSYKVRRRFTPPTPTLAMVSKPFRHKRAPWVLEHEASKKA